MTLPSKHNENPGFSIHRHNNVDKIRVRAKCNIEGPGVDPLSNRHATSVYNDGTGIRDWSNLCHQRIPMMNPEKCYIDREYWDKRYEEEKEPFEWWEWRGMMIIRVAGYESIKQYDINRFIHKEDSILFTGCGSSRSLFR